MTLPYGHYSIALVGLPSMGYMAGNYVSDVKSIELRQELKNLRDSLSKNRSVPQGLRTSSVNSKPKGKEQIGGKSTKSNLPKQ